MAAARSPAIRRTALSAAGVRWDRIGRVALLLVLVGVIALYVNPLRSYWSSLHQANAKRQQVHQLQAQHTRLLARNHALHDPATLERDARQLGMIRPGEQPYVVQGLPRR